MTDLWLHRLIAAEKITNYLLNEEHPDGGAKARYFGRFGFNATNAYELTNALLEHPLVNPVVAQTTNEYGTKRVVECNILTPDGRNPCIRSVWIADAGDHIHRFVTAIPVGPIFP